MIVGNGMLANAFQPFQDGLNNCLIFASGVSNSGETRTAEFIREYELLKNYLDSNYTIIYFSTCSIYDLNAKDSDYVKHKLRMENLIEKRDNYYIFRLPQVVGNTSNPFTLINYLYNNISSKEFFNLWENTTRNLIDVDDVVKFINFFIRSNIGFNKISNIACPFSVKVEEIVAFFEDSLKLDAKYNLVQSSSNYKIETKLMLEYSSEAGVDFDDSYIERLLSKYYL